MKRRVGSELNEYRIQESGRVYQQYMGGVDKGDQIREQGGGFGKSVKCKKWFKSRILGMMDFGLLNAHIAWNIKAKQPGSQLKKLTYFQFQLVVVEQLMKYGHGQDDEMDNEEKSDNDTTTAIHSESFSQTVSDQDGMVTMSSHHYPCLSTNLVSNPCWIVCKLEKGMMKSKGFQESKKGNGERAKKCMVKCAQCEGEVWLHTRCS